MFLQDQTGNLKFTTAVVDKKLAKEERRGKRYSAEREGGDGEAAADLMWMPLPQKGLRERIRMGNASKWQKL